MGWIFAVSWRAVPKLCSYSQSFKVPLNIFRQRSGFLVQVGEFSVDVGDGLLEIEVIVNLRRRDADVAAGGEAPVSGFDFSPGNDLAEAGDGLKFGVGKPVLKPNNLVIEVKQRFELSGELVVSAIANFQQAPQL